MPLCVFVCGGVCVHECMCLCIKDIALNITHWEKPAGSLLIPQHKSVCPLRAKDKIRSSRQIFEPSLQEL